MKAIAPGKLILSGEHAAVYGRPALAMAVDRSAESVITADSDDQVRFDLLDYSESTSFTYRTLREFKQRVIKNYRMFLNGELGIRDVLHKPIDLLEFTVITLLDGLHLKANNGMRIQLQSNIPIGCGMGSSAATILSVLRGAAHFLGVDFQPERYFDYGMEAEKLQHGKPSGVDSYVSLHGGCVRFQKTEDEELETHTLPLPRNPMYLVNTGTPQTTTGECVVHVAKQFSESAIWDEFEEVTLALEEAFRGNDERQIQELLKANHRLLRQIGVVPNKVDQFVQEIENWGAGAKICGAGAVQGENGGVVLVAAESAPTAICDKYGYEVRPVRGDPLGARIV